MINWVVSSSLLILFVLIVRQIFKGRISFRLQYALWFLVMLRLLLPWHIGSSQISFANISQDGQRYIEQNFVEPVVIYSQPEYRPNEILESNSQTVQTDDNIESTAKVVTKAQILEFVWIGGAFAVAFCVLISNLSFYGKLKRSRRYIDCGFKLPVYKCSWVKTPFMFGFIKPAIYIGDIIDKSELSHILCHEYMHYKQGDHIWSALRSICIVVHWYNPLVWIAAIISRRDAELACDEAVINAIGSEERLEYGRTLLRMTIQGQGSIFNMATSMNNSKRGIAERIHFIAKQPYMKLYSLLIVVIAIVVVAGCSFVGAEKEETGESVVPQPTIIPQQIINSSPVPTVEPEPLRHSESFLNNDGNVEFFFDFEVPELAEAMPILDAKTRDITIEDAQKLTKAVFGTTDIYQRTEHIYQGHKEFALTKEAIEEYLAFAYAMKNDESLMLDVYGEEYISVAREIVDNAINRHGRADYYEQAISDADRDLMPWEFKIKTDDGRRKNLVLDGSYEMDELRYYISASNYEDEYGSNHSLYIMVEQHNLAEMNREKTYYEHCSIDVPTQEQFEAAQIKAQQILESFEPGKWSVEACQARQTGNNRYFIEVIALPVYEGFKHIQQNSLWNDHIEETVLFEFGVDGSLLFVRYLWPVDVSIKNKAVDTIDFNKTIKSAKNSFSAATIEEFDYWYYISGSDDPIHDGVSSKVYISDVQQGWIRVLTEGDDNALSLQPVISFIGYFESFDAAGEETNWSKSISNVPTVLLNISALDGSVLHYESEIFGVNGLPRN